MDENEDQNLDSEYKRYLEIMRPYLGQLLDKDVIDICNAWIQRLSYCNRNEKVLRNRYVFSMCYQLARGVLEGPFIRNPPSEELKPLPDSSNSGESDNESSEVEYLVLDLDNANTKILFNKPNSIQENLSGDSEIKRSDELFKDSKASIIINGDTNTEIKNSPNLICYQCPNILPDYKNTITHNDNYEQRANNLVVKLREIKNQNLILHNELMALREESKVKHELEKSEENVIRIDNATSAYICAQDSFATLNSLKFKLQEVQESRNALIEAISSLQDKLDNFNEMKKHEIEDIYAKHKLDIIQIKTSVREETKRYYEKNIEELKQKNEQLVKDIQNQNIKEIENLTANTEVLISEKDKVIQSNQAEISRLKSYIEEIKSNQYIMFSKLLDYPQSDFNSKTITQKAEELEKRLNKMEKSKLKCSKAYETKLANVQREKHLAECSLQLQLVKQRAQILHDTADDHQTELATALDKLENKYKDIVASVQATAVQRRIQDQMALEAIIQTVCSIRSEGFDSNIPQTMYFNQVSNKILRNQERTGIQSRENELSTRNNKEVVVGEKTFGNAMAGGYCLDSNKFGELFEKVYIPQRDTGEGSPKK